MPFREHDRPIEDIDDRALEIAESSVHEDRWISETLRLPVWREEKALRAIANAREIGRRGVLELTREALHHYTQRNMHELIIIMERLAKAIYGEQTSSNLDDSVDDSDPGANREDDRLAPSE